MSKNKNLHKARKAKDDEFYTRLTDIEKELAHYRSYFEGKSVLCNCDDPEASNFWKYFELNFDFLGLTGLTATHYDPDRPSYRLELCRCGGKLVKRRAALTQNGDFRSPECLELLREADLVITNPPFSLLREYIDLLIESGVKFLIVGTKNAITYKNVFSYIQDGRLWLGVTAPPEFIRPDGSSRKFGNTCWLTNLEHMKRREKILCWREYDPAEYPRYDNYDAIEVSRVADIPLGYDGVMGVPITFLDKYNPEQFEIMGLANSARWIGYECLTLIEGRKVYNRIMIRHKRRPTN